MTLPELSYDLLETVRNAHIVDDERIPHSLLYEWINNQRALWVRNETAKGRSLDDNILQDIIADVSLVDSSLHPSINSNEVLLRTDNEIPPLVELHHDLALLEIKDTDLNNYSFSIVPYGQLRFSGNNRFNSKQIFVSLRGRYYFVKYGKDHLNPYITDKIIIRGVFQTPSDVPGYNIETSEYPLNRFMYNYMKDQILKSNLQVVLNTKADEANDASGQIKI